MKLIANSGNDRVVDELRKALPGAGHLDVASPEFSLFAFGEVRDLLGQVEMMRLVLPRVQDGAIGLLGGDGDRTFRNRLDSRALARACAAWIDAKAEGRSAPGPLPQAALIASDGTRVSLRQACRTARGAFRSGPTACVSLAEARLCRAGST